MVNLTFDIGPRHRTQVTFTRQLDIITITVQNFVPGIWSDFWASLNFGPATSREKNRKWCIWAHYTYAQVGSKTDVTIDISTVAQTCYNIFMFIESSKWDIRSSDIPNINAEIHEESTASDIESPLWAPLNSSHWCYRLNAVDVLDFCWVVDIPNLNRQRYKTHILSRKSYFKTKLWLLFTKEK